MKIIYFLSEGKKLIAKAQPHNDAFYEITEGPLKGNLVHIMNIVRTEDVTPYGELKLKFPDLNWEEAEEVSPEDLEAAADYFDRIKNVSEDES